MSILIRENFNKRLKLMEIVIVRDLKKRKELLDALEDTRLIDQALQKHSSNLSNLEFEILGAKNEKKLNMEHLLTKVNKLKGFLDNPTSEEIGEYVGNSVKAIDIESKDVSESFSNLISQIKRTNMDIANSLAKQGKQIESAYLTSDGITGEVSQAKVTLNGLMEKSSNTCLIVTIVLECIVLLLVLLSI